MIMEIGGEISTMMEICGRLVLGKGVVAVKYREAIIEIVGKIRSDKTLKRIYKFVSYLYTHETGG